MLSDLENSVNQLTSQRTFAVGNDLVHIENFKVLLCDLFKKKVYTPAEIAYCESFSDSLQRYASTWAAKEAVFKAIKQLDSSPLGWKKIEIIRNKYGCNSIFDKNKISQKINKSIKISFPYQINQIKYDLTNYL